MLDYSALAAALGIIAGTSASVWGLAWWLSGKFSEFNKNFFTHMDVMKKEITTKLEYHEKHDDSRFSEIRNDIWQMRVDDAARNAAIVLVDKARDEKEKERDKRYPK